jgi:hypothetical protein
MMRLFVILFGLLSLSGPAMAGCYGEHHDRYCDHQRHGHYDRYYNHGR